MEQHTWSSICGLFRLNVNSSNLSTSLVYFRWLFPDAPYMEYICQGLPPQNGPKDPECKSYSHHGAYTWLVNDTATHPDLQHVGSGSTRRLFWLFDSFTPQMVFLHKYCRHDGGLSRPLWLRNPPAQVVDHRFFYGFNMFQPSFWCCRISATCLDGWTSMNQFMCQAPSEMCSRYV